MQDVKSLELLEDAVVGKRINIAATRAPRAGAQKNATQAVGATRQAALHLRVTKTAESLVRGGHPWVFASSILEQNRPGVLGEFAALYDRKDRFLALGLFDADSPIRVRVLLAGKPTLLDDAWWEAHLDEALGLRDGLFGPDTTGFRWLNGESDGWPGLVLDKYGGSLVLKLYSASWLPRLDYYAALFQRRLTPERIVLRLSRNIQSLAREQFQKQDGQALFGAALRQPVEFLESGLRFEADVLRGQKTGFFLDQRENRRTVAQLAKGREVLNVFSFSGAFSIYAARGGAASTCDVDISLHALDSAKRNFALNASLLHPSKAEFVQVDAFDWLAAARPRFGLIILDPPSLARRESERSRAITAYTRLAELAAKRLAPSGILVSCSCSAHVSESEFFAAVGAGCGRSGRAFNELARTGLPADHPASFPEAKYLKAIYLQLKPTLK